MHTGITSRFFKATALFTTILSISALCFSFSEKTSYTTPGLITTYSRDLDEALKELDKAADDFKYNRISVDSLRGVFTNTRLIYKKIEFYLAFHYPEFVKEHINGAPLLHIEKEGTRPKVLVPEGFQVLDELIFADNALEEKSEIAGLAKRVQTYYTQLHLELDKNRQAGQYGIKAMRLQLVRLFTMGITGFDTPGSLNGLQEAKVSLEGIKQYLIENYKAASPATLALLDDAIATLQQEKSFDDFDRLTFFKTYIDPVYKQLGALDTAPSTEFIEQTTAWNPASTSIFGKDFLNPYFFTGLTKGEDNAKLRALGKDLFFDPLISNDSKVSCATCHQPELAYSDGLPKSVSNVQGKTVLRNAPTLLNAVYADRYFYDLRAFTLEQQAEHVIFNKDEFNTAYPAILKKLETNTGYAKKFKAVFGNKGITRANFSKALASYVLSLQSFDSEFDKYMRGETAGISQDVKNGFNLFTGKAACATCHYSPTFSGLVPPFYNENESEILGVPAAPDTKQHDADGGRLDNQIYSEYAWIYEKSFKTTTVRNAALTAPYFHNGAYKTLEEVIDFYNNGGGTGMGLSVTNQTLPPDALNLTEQEKKDLIAFIKSLNNSVSY